MTEGRAIEREVKLGAWPGFEIPDLGNVLDEVTTEPVARQELDAIYFDTADLRLIRSGITVRHRTRGSDDPGEWTVKFPDDGPVVAGGLARREINIEGASGAVPADVEGLVRAYVRTSTLAPVAHLQTLRQSLALRGGDGARLAEVDDDEVTVLVGDRVAARFREVEAEVTSIAPEELLPRLVARLRDAGAGAPDPTPKLVRALGPRALAPADLVPVEVGADAAVADVLRAGINAAVLRVVEHHHVIQLDDDPEGVHQARVGTRRLRSDLRTFAPVLDNEWSQPLRDELSWLADELGAVRDRDVLLARLQRHVLSLPKDDQPGADPLRARLAVERDEAQRALIDALSSPRYYELLERLVDAAQAPRVERSDARKPAAEVLPALAGRPWKKLRKAVDQLGAMPSDEALHEVRIRVKRARYAADVAVPVVGEPARAYAKGMANLQDTLGEHHDAIVAEDWLRAAAASATGALALAAGQLIAAQRAEAAALREAWPEAWRRAAEKRSRKWLS